MSMKKAELSAGHMARNAAASSGSWNCAATDSSERGPHLRTAAGCGSMRGSSFAVPPSPMSSRGGTSAIMSLPTSFLAAPKNSLDERRVGRRQLAEVRPWCGRGRGR